MTGSSWAAIVIPIVTLIALGLWLAVVFYADSHPMHVGRRGAAEPEAGSDSADAGVRPQVPRQGMGDDWLSAGSGEPGSTAAGQPEQSQPEPSQPVPSQPQPSQPQPSQHIPSQAQPSQPRPSRHEPSRHEPSQHGGHSLRC